MTSASDAALNDPLFQTDFSDTNTFKAGGFDNRGFDDADTGGNFSGSAKKFGGQANSLRDQAADRLRGFADEGKAHVTATLDGVVTAAREIADKLQDGAFGPVGSYAKDAADAVETWANGIKDKSVEELIDDGRDLVRSQPAIAVGVAVIAGFVLSRFLRAGA